MATRFFKIISVSLVMLFLSFSFTACSFHSGIRINSKYSSSKKYMSASFTKLSEEDTKNIKLSKDDTLTITYTINIESGSLEISLYDPDETKIFTLDDGKKGKEEVNISKSGTYKITVTGNDAKGSYDLNWETK
jgi:hypothetical protein